MTSGPLVAGMISLGGVRGHRAELSEVTGRLERVLAHPDTDPDWRSGFDDAVTTLRRVFAEHRRMTEDPDGFYPELLDTAPRLTRAVRGLVAEHEAVSAALDALADPAAEPGTGDAHALRWQAARVLRKLAKHRQRGADLVYEAYATDLGGET